ncbi:helix-turn-helix domain-containing protein [Streptomyces sp. NPDC052727]|uniref:AraC-like ligand-binding domain-containing protein n=1 Tax=Streptomyces sp. NPDC052727 TaxID=3154854 RepID=UPI003448214F
MVRETVFRSEDVPAAGRFDYWRELMIQTLAPLDMSSDHADDFQASMHLLELGAVHVSPQTFQSMRFHRTPKLIRQSDPELFHMSLVTRGTVGIVQHGQETTYNPGDLCVLGSSQPFDCLAVSGRRAVETVAVALPTEMLASAENAVNKLIGHPISGRAGFGALLAQFLSRITTDTGSFTSCDGPRLGVIVLDLLSGLLAHILEAEKLLTPESHRRTLVLRIRAFVRSHLHDPQLTPRSIAAAHNISTSYLHRLFQHEEETIAAWIRHQRLDHARRDLADPALRTTPIHAIAARWGFPRAADFTRAFRAAYGMPPSAYRHHADASVRVDASLTTANTMSAVVGG